MNKIASAIFPFFLILGMPVGYAQTCMTQNEVKSEILTIAARRDAQEVTLQEDLKQARANQANAHLRAIEAQSAVAQKYSSNFLDSPLGYLGDQITAGDAVNYAEAAKDTAASHDQLVKAIEYQILNNRRSASAKANQIVSKYKECIGR